MIRVLVVDDHELVRAGLIRLLDADAQIEVIGETGSGRDAIRLCGELEPDVVLLDFSLPDIDGLETTRQLQAQGHKARILILTMYAHEEYATRLMQAGASGFVVKAAPADALLTAVRKVAADGVYVSPEILEKMVVRMGKPATDAPEAVLSTRELQVLVRLARGLSTREVALDLCLSLSTVETYRSRILEKLSLRNQSDMTRFAIRRGLVEAD